MKIRIIGPCGSGKSTLAKKLSMLYNIPYFEIDHIIWDRSSDNLKYPEHVRDATLRSILESDSWIVEGVQFKDWALSSIEKADVILLLNPHVFVRDYRIIKRFILSRTGIRPWNYKQTFRNLWKMVILWNHGFDNGEVLGIVNGYGKKVFIVRNKKEVIHSLKEQVK